MKKRVIISSIYSANTIKYLILKTNPSKVILVVEENLFKSKGKDEIKKVESIEDIKKSFEDILKIEILETKSLYNLYEITKDIVKKIDSMKDEEIILNISEGRKTLSFGMYFAGYLRKEKINQVGYLIKETNEFLKLPLLNFNVNDLKKEILKKIEKKPKNIKDLKEQINKSKSVFYQYIKELEKEGYIKIENNIAEITNTGRILLL